MYAAPKLASSLILLGAITCTSWPVHAEVLLEQRCNDDGLDIKQARLRVEWARACALKWNTNGPNDKFDTGEKHSNGSVYWDYFEKLNPSRSYLGPSYDSLINYMVDDSLYIHIGERDQSLDSAGFWRWTRPTLKPHAQYPTFSTDINLNLGKALWPHPTLADCNLYPNKDGTGLAASQFYVVGYCTSSCYTPEQEILFPSGYQKIQEAVDQLRPDMVTLTPDSTLDDIQLEDNLVYSYTAEIRDTTNVIYEISTASGQLRVTHQHPVIRGDGKIVQARTLRVGDDLIRVDGSLDAIVSIKKTRHFGKVYNIRPVTHDPVSNILVAQGYLVGSSTFQNDDVGYINRIILGRAIPEHLIPSVADRMHKAAGLSERERGLMRSAEPMATPLRPTATSGDAAREAEAETQELEPDDEYEQSEVMRAVLGEDPMLSEFWGYHKQVLKDEEQREGYRAFLSSPAMLVKVREDLLFPGETRRALQRNLKLLIEIDYLREALGWERNPRREEILALIEELLLEDSFGHGRDAGMRYSLATAKKELYQLLHDHDASRAQGVMEASRGSRLEGLLAFIADDLQLRHQKELELGLYPWIR